MRPPPRHPLLLVAVWLAFLARGLFYCVEQPMWEGYDEWAHFAYLQHLVEHHTPPSRTDLAPYQVLRSLQLVPLPKSGAEVISGAITHDAFWKLDSADRRQREQQLRQLTAVRPAKEDPVSPAWQYEAQQPPLYYVLLVPAYLLLQGQPLPVQVLILRIVSLLISSSVVFLVYFIARRVLRNRTLALLTAILIACLPELAINVSRIGNECLTIPIVSAIILCSLRACERQARTLDWLLLGILMGAALLAKAYAVVFLPLLALVAIIRSIRYPQTLRQTAGRCCLAYTAAFAIGGWWYWRTWITTGTISGEQLDVAASKIPLAQKLSTAWNMDWRAVADSAAFSHIWMGGWSFLVVRSWMYRICELVAVLAAIGLVIALFRIARQRRLRSYVRPPAVLVIAYLLMCFAVAYSSLAAFQARNILIGVGWYLYSVVAAEGVLLALGLTAIFGRRWSRLAVASVSILAIALDLYTVHFMLLPYHAGLIAHRASGSLEAFHIATLVTGIGDLFQRLSLNKPALMSPAAIAAIWAVYLFSTLALPVTAIRLALTPPRSSGSTAARSASAPGGSTSASADPLTR